MAKKTARERANSAAEDYSGYEWVRTRSSAEREMAAEDFRMGFLTGYRAAKRDEKSAAKGRGTK